MHHASMSALFPAWLWLLFGLLPVEIQSRAVQGAPSLRSNSLTINKRDPKSSNPTITPDASDFAVIIDSKLTRQNHRLFWRTWVNQGPPAPELFHRNTPQKAPVWQRKSRDRRHANSGVGGRGHGHLMRVGCVLGTCQVQNLSHRLYQLIGQSGREDSSPINPRSPHSYG